ncbi:hypothetical protein LTR86_000292 [Recurvomyces mirabilis]|nr:hypothetical protein LTR86_000292 [Recurvomyces mirabilis]
MREETKELAGHEIVPTVDFEAYVEDFDLGDEEGPRFRLRFVLNKDKCVPVDPVAGNFVKCRSTRGLQERLREPWTSLRERFVKSCRPRPDPVREACMGSQQGAWHGGKQKSKSRHEYRPPVVQRQPRRRGEAAQMRWSEILRGLIAGGSIG